MTQTTPFIRKKCPICDKSASEQYRPFCSRRCSDIDLSRWLNGAYAIPGDEQDSISETDNENTHPDQSRM